MNKEVTKGVSEMMYKNRKPDIILKDGTKVYLG